MSPITKEDHDGWAEMALNLELRVGRPSGAKLVQDYLAGRPEALAFYRGSPDMLASYTEKEAEVSARFDRESRERAAGAVHAPTDATRAKLARFVEEGGLFVTTGQQPGLFTGPLYSLYKGLTAARLADTLEAHLGCAVIPLFWVASEDHDWAECDHTFVLSTENELHRLALNGPEGRDDRPLHRVPMGPEIADRLDEISKLFPDNDFKHRYLEILRSAYTPQASMGEAFRAAIEPLLAPAGMAFVDAAAPPLKAASQDVLLRALDDAKQHEELLNANAKRLSDAGYDVQVPILPEGVNLFMEGPAGRERVYRDGAGVRLRHSGESLTRDDILTAVERDPATLSPNVLLRPVVESTVFPVVSYVAGPGEIAYYGQLADLFEINGIRMPVIHPRFGATVVESKTRKVLDKFGLDADDLARPHHQLSGDIVRDELPDAVRQALGALRGGIAKGVGELANAVADVDPTLKGPVGHVRSVAFAALDEVNKKIVQSLKRENEIALGQLEKAQTHLFPEGRPQERSLNAFYYLMRYGDAFLDAVREAFEVSFEGEGTP